MSPVGFPRHLFILPFLLLSAAGCTWIVDERLDEVPGVHCDEHNLRLERELALESCATVVGERFTVHLKQWSPETLAVVSFAPADAPQEVLESLEVGVLVPGMVSFTIPDLPAAPGTRLRVQIQGSNVLNAFSGHFEIELDSSLAGIGEDGLVSFWFAGDTPEAMLYGRIPTDLGDASEAELIQCPCGRHLAAGARAVSDGPVQRFSSGAVPRDLVLLEPFERAVTGRLEGTGGIDSVGFLPPAGAENVRAVWSRHDAQTGRWRLVACELGPDGPGPTVLIGGVPDFSTPPRLESGFGAVLVLPRDHIPAWLGSQPEPEVGDFFQITPELVARRFSCAELFGPGLDAAFPVEGALVKDPRRGRMGLFSCAVAGAQGPLSPFTVNTRWIPWGPDGPRVEAAEEVFSVSSCGLPLGWNLPARPDSGSPLLLETLPDDDGVCGPLLVEPPGADPVEVDVSGLAGTGVRTLLIDARTALLYVPGRWKTSGDQGLPDHLVGIRMDDGWHFEPGRRDLEHALVWSGDLLLLANTTQMIQSTMGNFTAGLPGALIAPTACGFAVLKPSYR